LLKCLSSSVNVIFVDIVVVDVVHVNLSRKSGNLYPLGYTKNSVNVLSCTSITASFFLVVNCTFLNLLRKDDVMISFSVPR